MFFLVSMQYFDIFRPSLRSLRLQMFTKLEENMRERYGSTPRIRASNVAICETSGEVSFFVVIPKFAEDYPSAPHFIKYQVSSMSRDQVLKHAKKIELSAETFGKYVEERKVPCRSPSDLFRDTNVDPRDLNLLIIDVEGFDDQVVSAFLDVDGCMPNVISFEFKHLRPEAKTAVPRPLSKALIRV